MLPQPEVKAQGRRRARSGSSPTQSTPIPGQKVTFVEAGESVHREIGTAKGRRGTLRFTPTNAPGRAAPDPRAGQRRTAARARPSPSPATRRRRWRACPGSHASKVSRTATRRRLSWKRVPRAHRYEVTVRVAGRARTGSSAPTRPSCGCTGPRQDVARHGHRPGRRHQRGARSRLAAPSSSGLPNADARTFPASVETKHSGPGTTVLGHEHGNDREPVTAGSVRRGGVRPGRGSRGRGRGLQAGARGAARVVAQRAGARRRTVRGGRGAGRREGPGGRPDGPRGRQAADRVGDGARPRGAHPALPGAVGDGPRRRHLPDRAARRHAHAADEPHAARAASRA